VGCLVIEEKGGKVAGRCAEEVWDGELCGCGTVITIQLSFHTQG
jgi:hypothetical protein